MQEHRFHPSRALLLFFSLFADYGDPGPWPWFHIGRRHTRDEIAIGSLLVSHTNWRNVEYALSRLREAQATRIPALYRLVKKNKDALMHLIRPAGFYRQKAQVLALFAAHVVKRYGTLATWRRRVGQKTREELLSLRGIGKETADTMLLYAFDQPSFVVDTYTKRFVQAHGLSITTDYDKLQSFFTSHLPHEVQLYKDYHALIVAWGKDRNRRDRAFRRSQDRGNIA
jgi:endonuclease-3 related protein